MVHIIHQVALNRKAIVWHVLLVTIVYQHLYPLLVIVARVIIVRRTHQRQSQQHVHQRHIDDLQRVNLSQRVQHVLLV